MVLSTSDSTNQAQLYLMGLHELYEALADNPNISQIGEILASWLLIALGTGSKEGGTCADR